jgi:hypothetical protein
LPDALILYCKKEAPADQTTDAVFTIADACYEKHLKKI